ncbi:MAG: cytochrome c biogenesis protein CcsA [Deltaproteobacteria bacterium]|nr:cytochrome c biogenesis protein CcsA [Deltaproteobacteria bacterium]MCW5805204.1 cytochrome c biogenesis protein CcsA [Deltaproteobacteria bacterium]
MTGDRLLSVAPSPAFWVAVAAYAAASAALFMVLAGKTSWKRIALGLVVFAFVAHGTDIGWRGTLNVHPAQSVREAIGFLSFILTGGYLLASTRYQLTLGGVVIMPVALVMLLAARLTPAGAAPDGLDTLGRIHISLATIGVGVFALASALSAIYLVENRALKKKKFDSIAFTKASGAPLEGLDRLSHRLVLVGFPIFTVALVLGAVWVSRLGESLDRPEYPLAAVTWLAFAGLLLARQVYGWRGARAAKLTLAGFAAAIAVLAIYLIRRMVA